ncbi:MAG: class I SAM-dependent methyltransferase [Deltaproteobacteria bacterium]|jgi:16S rRNA (guanine527-N7)-methyltransferase|nr:class I SAM-dependent methyltransferase [Deltaproteobacteria bacterium]
MNKTELEQICAGQGFALGEDALDGLAAYLELLGKWNKVMNLVGPHALPEILRELILDSFHLARFLEDLPLPEAPESWDFGAGAGLPGVPLRLVWQAGAYTMVEAREKRALFLQNALAACSAHDPAHYLSRTSVYRGRAENFISERLMQKKPGDLLISRAFMPWEKLLPFAHDGLSADGRVIFLTLTPAPVLPSELAANWKLEAERAYASPAGKQRYFWALKKTSCL